MLSWDQWEVLLIKALKNDKNALTILLKESEAIIRKKASITIPINNEFELEDIVQDTLLRVITKLDTIKNPRSYVRWIKTVTWHLCSDFKKKKREEFLEGIDDKTFSITKSGSTPDLLNDIKGFKERGINGFQNQVLEILLEKDNQEKTTRMNLDILKALGTEKRPIKDDKIYVEVITNILQQALLDKEEFNYSEAEKKLDAIIRYTRKIKLTPELRYLRARALFEQGHIKMNEGLVEGPNGSIFWYIQAQKQWKKLHDKPNELYTIQQIGVSYHIRGKEKEALSTYESIISDISRKKTYRGLKSDVWRDHSIAQMALGNIRDSKESVEKSLELAKEKGGIGFLYSKLQRARIYLLSAVDKKFHYDKAHTEIMEVISDTPRYRVLDHVKANLALLDLHMAMNRKDEAIKLIPSIRQDCLEYFFWHQLGKLNHQLRKYSLI